MRDDGTRGSLCTLFAGFKTVNGKEACVTMEQEGRCVLYSQVSKP